MAVILSLGGRLPITRSDGIMKKSKISKSDYRYNPPIFFMGVFYASLLIWTVLCIWLIGSKTISAGWPVGQLLMIGFVLAYTWYFSLGISYKIKVDTGGNIELTSFRRVLRVNAKDISMVEGPRFAVLPYGFIRFRLEREKAYLFSRITDEELKRILNLMRKSNKDMKFKGI
jgi:hypothetical protein